VRTLFGGLAKRAINVSKRYPPETYDDALGMAKMVALFVWGAALKITLWTALGNCTMEGQVMAKTGNRLTQRGGVHLCPIKKPTLVTDWLKTAGE